MKCFSTIIILLFGCLTACFAQTSPHPGFQSWNEIQLIVPLVRKKDAQGKNIDKVTAVFSGIARFGRSNYELVDNRYGVTVDFRLNKYVSSFGGTLYRRDELTDNAIRYETRLLGGAVISGFWRKFVFRDRNMFEHRVRNSRNDTNLYRQRIQISRPLKYKERELFSPFISEECYYEFTSGRWVQNEFYAGITRRLNAKTSLDIAYVRNDSRPTNVNGLSMNLRIRVR